MNTIINFGDSLEADVMSCAEQHARANDVVLCLGSTLTVTPACNYVIMGDPVRLAICNRCVRDLTLLEGGGFTRYRTSLECF